MLDDPKNWYSDPTNVPGVAAEPFPALRRQVDDLLNELIRAFYAEVPYAAHQMSAKELNLEYYKRHNIETIVRLRRKRTIDAMAIHYFTKRDPVRGAQWAHYVEDEMLHDAWFASDLHKVGVSRADIYATEPMLSTKLLTGYLQYGMEFEGSPLALLCSVYFVEYTTTETQPSWIDNLGKVLGEDKVQGARRHVGTDLEDKHADFVWSVLASVINDTDDEQRVLQHMRNVANLWVAYFIELYNFAIGTDAGAADGGHFEAAKALTSMPG
jgi:hypothetical protein